MLTISENYIHIDHIMWQPIFHCVANCKSCYVAASPSSKYNGPLRSDILKLIFEQERVTCDQLTISLDTLEIAPTPLLNELKWLWSFYIQGIDSGLEIKSYSLNGKSLPELCITVQNYQTLNRWAKWLDMDLVHFLKPISILSISCFPTRENDIEYLTDACKLSRTVLNYNICIREGITKSKQWKKGIEYADHVYLVLEKQPLGCCQPIRAKRNLFKAYKEVLNTKHQIKIHLDVCIQDALKNLFNNNISCSAGINKIHIWPDGSVSGCPYDSYHRGHDRVCHKYDYDLFNEIKKVITKKEPAFSLCQIPDMLDTGLKNS